MAFDMSVFAAFGVQVERCEFVLGHHRRRLIDIHVARGSVDSFRRQSKLMINALCAAHAIPRTVVSE
jgi:hypothetical protein